MNTPAILGFVLLAICLIGVTSVGAQVPNIAVYYDDIHTEAVACQGMSVLDTLYVVAQNIGTFINAAEYRIQYSPMVSYLIWVSDMPAALGPYSFAIGMSPSGISIGWNLPQNAFAPFIVQRILILWACTGCGPVDVVRVLPHPATSFLGVGAAGESLSAAPRGARIYQEEEK